VKDGGTLQLGIGSVGDSVAHWLGQRHAANAEFREAARALGLHGHELVEREGGCEPFTQGLFASSEMFTWGMMTLFRAGVIRRRASDTTGPVLQAAFFLGPSEFYRALHDLSDEQRESIRMTSVSSINDLFGEEALARQQRRDARFINICMMVTLSGAATSDGLADGRVVSGVGGQYNFVAQAHELEGARSILLLRSTRESARRTESNIVFNYGHATIPRHLRDIVVTEYGIADLRGKSDSEIAIALISIADARFQAALADQAKRSGKLARGWQIPDAAKLNTPDQLDERLAPLAARGLLPPFPLGTDFDAVEQRLVPALTWLKRNSFGWRNRLVLATATLTASPAPEDRPALERLGLATPKGWRERALRGVVAHGLSRSRRSP
jgi:acyl-CoA hydrolase